MSKAEELAKEEYPSLIGTTQTGIGYNMNSREQEAFVKGYNSRQSEIDELTKERDRLQSSLLDVTNRAIELTKEVEILEEWNKKYEDNQVENFERVKNQEHKIVELTKEVERLRKERHILLLDFYKGLKNIGRLYSDNTSEEIMMNDVSEFLTTH